MSKKGSSGKRSSSRRDVSNNPIANHRLPTRGFPQLDLIDYLNDLRTVEDRRTYHPEGDSRAARTVRGDSYYSLNSVPNQSSSRSTSVSLNSSGGRVRHTSPRLPEALHFSVPQDVLVCVRRKKRKEVLHALKKTGKSGQKRPRRNYYSDIHC